jgi:hypothetical protein
MCAVICGVGNVGIAVQGGARREAPVRTEPHPTDAGAFRAASPATPTPTNRYQVTMCAVIGGVGNVGVDGAGRGQAGSPGSDGAPPYRRRDL